MGWSPPSCAPTSPPDEHTINAVLYHAAVTSAITGQPSRHSFRGQKVESYPPRGGTFGEAVIMRDFLTIIVPMGVIVSLLAYFF
jgi:hypothetical protein